MTTDNNELFQDEFLTTPEVAELLKIPVKTITQLAREGKIPGKKYGKHWRFLRSQLILEHTREDAVAVRREVVNSHGSISEVRERKLVRGVLVPGPGDGEFETIPPFDWSKDVEEAGSET